MDSLEEGAYNAAWEVANSGRRSGLDINTEEPYHEYAERSIARLTT